MMWNSDFSETNLIETASANIRQSLPPGWSLDSGGLRYDERLSGFRFDGLLEISDPQGRSAVIVAGVRRNPMEARQVIRLVDDWQRLSLGQSNDTLSQSGVVLMAVAPYIGPSARQRLAESGVSFADYTGNLRLVVNSPAIFIEAQGAGKNPYRENVPLRSLKGRGAARALRGLLDYRPPFGTRELANAIKCPAATVSRVSELLERETILFRDAPRGPIISVDWERLLRRWAADYDFLNANRMMAWIEPRGMRTLFNKLHGADFEYAVTGSFAAVRLAPVAEPRLAAIYAANPSGVAGRLGLRPADTGGNVLIGRPLDSAAFERTQCADGIIYVWATQAAADLMTGPGRSPAEAESLIEWMRSNEDVWRIPFLMKAT